MREFFLFILFLLVVWIDFHMGFIAPYALLVTTILWYVFSGHRLVGWFIDKVFRGASGTEYNTGSIFRREVDRLKRKSQYEKAILKCREWLKHDRNTAEPILMMCGILSENLKDPKQAIAELEISISRPFPAEEHVALAKCLAQFYRKEGREPEVQQIFGRIRSLHSKSPCIADLN